MCWAHRALVAAIAVAATVSPASAARRTTILTVVLNDVVGTDQVVYLEDDGDALVPVDALRAAGFVVAGQTERVDGVLCVRLRSLPLTFVIDEESMSVRLTAGVADLPASRIDLNTRRAPDGLQARTGTSFYVNYGAHSFGSEVDAYGEAGLRSGAMLAYSSAVVLPDHTVVRGLSHVTLDDRRGLRRFVAGDQLVRGGPLGGGAVIGGAHVIRSFELDPYLLTAPAIDLSGSVLVPSTAEIYINGVLLRREKLAPGRYTLANLPLTRGAGDVQVVLRDALGRQQALTTGFYVPGGLLRPGLTDYHLAIGAERDRMGRASFDYDRPMAIARYQRGLTSRLTVGVRASATFNQGGAGASVIAGLPFGQLDGAAGVSTDGGVLGAAASLGWSYISRRGAFSIDGRRITDRYATVDVDRAADRVIAEARAQGSLSFGRGFSAGAQLSANSVRDRGASSRIAVHGTTTPANGVTLSLYLGRSAEWQQPTSYDAMATLSIGLSSRTRGSITQRLGAVDRTQIEVHRSLADRPGLGYRALADLGDASRGAASVQAQTSFGRYEVSYVQVGAAVGTVEASAAGGLAVIGGRLFASTPIERSFALVRVPGAGGVVASLENHPVGRTDARGDLFIPNLQPYYGNNLSIDPEGLPFHRKLPATRQIVAPPAGGGVIVVFEAPALHLVRGTLRVEGPGGTTSPAYGELTVAGTFVSPVGSQGEFELDGLVAGRHPASVEWEGGRCAFELVVPASAQPIVALPIAVCRMPERKEAP